MRLRVVLAVLVLVATACGGDENDDQTAATTTAPATTTTAAPATTVATTTTTEPPTTTTEVTTTTTAPEPVLFTEPGPFEVGVITLDLGDRFADVYYPAVAEPDAETEIFDSISVFPESLQAFIPAELTGEVDTMAYRDALVFNDEQAFPVLVFSHGFGGFRQTSTFHLRHVASWGFVAVSADHLERGIAAQALGTLGGGAENQDVLDVRTALDALAAHPDLGPASDLDRVAITGHSAGGGTSARAAADDVIDAYLTIAAGTPETVIQKPAIVFIAENDATVEPSRSYGLVDALDDVVVVNIANAGNNSFTDSCAGIYDLGGLGMLVDVIGAEQVARAEDGCKEPAIRPELAYDVLNHYTVQFLIARFVDPAAAGPVVDVSDVLTPLVDFGVTGTPLG
ncbi:MAG: dienelactone hydrolase family protein [Actinomycetota bacterium]